MICDPESGICEIPEQKISDQKNIMNTGSTPLKVLYFTDPICSSCWGIEPQLRKLKLAYGDIIEIEYHMGGLLPDWSYNSGGISKPSDVAHHWDEVSMYYNMPIDGDVWLEDPLDSSYPPSIAFKAAQLQNENKAINMLRVMREMVFLKKMNIAKVEVIIEAATKAGLDINRFGADLNGIAKDEFSKDLALARSMHVRGFPTIFFNDMEGNTEMVYGYKAFNAYEEAITKLVPAAAKRDYPKDWKNLFQTYNTLTTREFAELSALTSEDADKKLNILLEAGSIWRYNAKNGALWISKP
ncbi:putative DsbA family dithiol-disulfide isomerase [Mucilaginibacter auburnensis]|uniref:Putative DsbA family dithiol-disulfide isomerase n=2 Tax=Mucilaginibacter auburnensis TaxID=1457233 RepID=A0A2H9VN64_9SPHI|nr:putative DsbA family dithiol-disulfide isomerase [Mucilaginibacter auburnensis]